MSALRSCAFACFFLLAFELGLAPATALAQRNRWIATWASSPESANPNPKLPILNIENQTVRERVRVSIGGSQVCLRLSNEDGSALLGWIRDSRHTD
jgi:hypothetical protein